MDVAFDILSLLCGLALFLYGMDVMGESLKKSAGSQLKNLLEKMTSNPVRGFFLGLGVTAVIQSSSATTVMVVGFVNSGTMTLLQSVGVIMGANVGTAVTAWITALSSIGGSDKIAWINWFKPDAWMPILAVIGICLIMFSKRSKKKDVGNILLGFAVLMVGMSLMSDAVKDYGEVLKPVFTMFSNPLLGLLAGIVLTVIVQSSSASVGILQSLTMTGAISYGAAIPIVMGQNIGTCITAIISSMGANKNGKRAAMIHLYFNIIGVAIWLSLYFILNAIFHIIPSELPIDAWGVALVHTVFKILSVATIAPFYRLLEKLAVLTIRDSKKESEMTALLDERLFTTPAFALAEASKVAYAMADISRVAIRKSFELFSSYDAKLMDEIIELEDKADRYEDALGTYLVKLSACDMTPEDSAEATKLLHIIGDLERLSDHAVNIAESAEEMNDKKLSFSSEATREIGVMQNAVSEILDLAYTAISKNDLTAAKNVEPLEETIDDLRDSVKANHVKRLQKSECTIEHGFVLSDILTNLERISDHCSNLASCVVEIKTEDALNMHKYTSELKEGSDDFKEKVAFYKEKYSL